MNPAFRPVLIVLGVLVLMMAFAGLRRANAPKDSIPWRKDLQAAKSEAATANKPVLAYFTATWCPPCQAMQRETWPDPRVAAALTNVVPVKIDVDQHPDVARDFGVSAIPRLQLIHPDGTPGATREAYTAPDELIEFLREK